jgi:hypothetical protein
LVIGDLPLDQAQPFKANDNLLVIDSDDSFGHSGMFVGHSTPKRNAPRLLRQEKSPAHDPLPTESPSSVEKIPSSTTPSPMKIRDSPYKKPLLDQQATRKLQESITNLLGKRRSSTEEIANAPQQGRVAKRTRPMSRTKVNDTC